MTLQINRSWLMANGYKVIAEYITFYKDSRYNYKTDKWENKTCKYQTISCFRKGNHMVIKTSSRDSHLTFEFYNKDDANWKVHQLLRNAEEGYKRIR